MLKLKTKLAWFSVGLGLCLLAGLLLVGFAPQLRERWAQAEGHRTVADHRAAPVDLTAHYTTPVSYFERITAFPAFTTVPRGFQVFHHVPLQIGGMICLWGEGNAKELKIEFPKIIPDIPVHQKFETLYVYHGAFFPSREGTPVCAVVLHYADGSAATNQLCYGADMLDWVANPGAKVRGPVAPRSTLAWVGGSFSRDRKQPLRLCLTALPNPHPELEVATLDLCSCQSRTAPCIMALTAGKSGLLH